MEVVVKPYNTIESAILGGDFDVVLGNRGYGLGTADPVSFLMSDYGCDGSYNLSQYCNADIDAELQSASEIATLTSGIPRRRRSARKLLPIMRLSPLPTKFGDFHEEP